MLKKGWKLATNELLSIKKISILWGEEIPVPPPSPYETLIIHYTPITTFLDSHACYLTHAHTHTFMLATDAGRGRIIFSVEKALEFQGLLSKFVAENDRLGPSQDVTESERLKM